MLKLGETDSGDVLNVNVAPPLSVAMGIRLEPAYAAKSDASAVVAPNALLTCIVQLIRSVVRIGRITSHDSSDAVVGLPYTTNDCEPLLINGPALVFSDTSTSKLVEFDCGVTVNVNAEPPLMATGAVILFDVDVTVKSVDMAVVGP